MNVSAATVHRRLTKLFELQPHFLKLVPHLLTCELKTKRIELAMELLKTLRSEEHTLFHRIITGDESWFCLDYSSDHILTCRSNDIPQWVNHQIQSEKQMLTVLWLTRESMVVKWMRRCQYFNTTYLIDEIISESMRNIKRMWNFPDKRWYRLHLNNARSYNSRSSVEYIDRNKFIRLPHPPYSSDLAPNNFYLFRTLKRRLVKYYGTTKEELFRNVSDILNSISEDELVQVFRNWMTRLEQVISTGGEYI
jgi:histone-lysine N-methyltransferase SETMAR